MLDYYENASDNKIKGSIDLTNCSIREVIIKDQQFCFEIVSSKKGNKKYLFRAPTDSDYKKWIETLKKLINLRAGRNINDGIKPTATDTINPLQFQNQNVERQSESSDADESTNQYQQNQKKSSIFALSVFDTSSSMTKAKSFNGGGSKEEIKTLSKGSSYNGNLDLSPNRKVQVQESDGVVTFDSYRGRLLKQGGMTKNVWQQRYFVCENNKLDYYDDESSDSQVKGSIGILNIQLDTIPIKLSNLNRFSQCKYSRVIVERSRLLFRNCPCER